MAVLSRIKRKSFSDLDTRYLYNNYRFKSSSGRSCATILSLLPEHHSQHIELEYIRIADLLVGACTTTHWT